ncbi:Activating transcription factor 7-interacting protein 1 [Trichoplax sp. H2]|nr:Activating transcription factor 7-interacting protein 1 [Trichoplax sp. H2]|eukprot:RDD45707.1 Activating transcription factor 7-interacting protein 1 [Trichoplax sp. H2]
MDLIGEIKIKQEKIDDYELDNRQPLSYDSNNLLTEVVQISDDESDIINLTAMGRQTNAEIVDNILTNEANTALTDAYTDHSALKQDEGIQDICLNEPTNLSIPSPNGDINHSGQPSTTDDPQQLNANIHRPDRNGAVNEQSAIAEKRKHSNSNAQENEQPAKKAMGVYGEKIKISQISHAQPIDTSPNHQHEDINTIAIKLPENNQMTQEQISNCVSEHINKIKMKLHHDFQEMYKIKVEELKNETDAIEQQCITFRDLFLKFVDIHCKEKSDQLYQSIRKLSDEAGLAKKYVPENRKCNVGIQVALPRVSTQNNVVIPMDSAAVSNSNERVRTNTMNSQSKGESIKVSLASQTANLRTTQPGPIKPIFTSTKTHSNSNLTNGVNNSVRSQVDPKSVRYQPLSSLRINDLRPSDPRISSSDDRSFFFPFPENICKQKLVEIYTPELKSIKSQDLIKLMWTLPKCSNNYDAVIGYDIYFIEDYSVMQSSKTRWKFVDTVEPLPLPMVCNLTPASASTCYFTLRSKLKNNCYSRFSNICKVS